MIITQEHKTDVISTGEKLNFSLDEKGQKFLFESFSNSIYSNKLGSIVREITSNCFDAHAEAGVDLPVRVVLDRTNRYFNKFSLMFIDQGIG